MSWTYGEFNNQVVYVNNNILQITNIGGSEGGDPSGNTAVYKLWDKNDVSFFLRRINSNGYIPRVEDDSDVPFEPSILISGDFNSVLIDLYLYLESEDKNAYSVPFLLEKKVDNGDWVDTGEVVFSSQQNGHSHLKFVDLHSLEGGENVFYRFKNCSIEQEIGNISALMHIGYTAFCKLEEF